MKICGIYKITNIINNKNYIGQSVDIYQRWKKETSNTAEKYSLQYAIQKYGVENFTFEIIEECLPEDLNNREQYWINYYDSYKLGYNETLGGDGAQKYNYLSIYNDWINGSTCKELINKYSCDDSVITKALRCYGITEEAIRRRNNMNISIPITMVDITSQKHLKKFSSCGEAALYLNLSASQGYTIQSAVKRNTKAFGYNWVKATPDDDNLPLYTLTELLSYQQLNTCLTQEHRNSLSYSLRQTTRPSREELKKLIRNESFKSIGQLFQVSDNTIRKWCDFYNLPRKKSNIKLYNDQEWEKI